MSRLLSQGRAARRLLLPTVTFAATTFRADAKASCHEDGSVFASKYAIGIGVTALGAGGLWVYYQRQGAAALRDGLESYEKGDLEVAAQNFQKAADLRNAEAVQLLAEMMLSGDGMERNTEEGIALLRKAAGLGHVQAQMRLASMFDTGRHGVSEDVAEAAQWYRKAARAGNGEAMNWLAGMHFVGNEEAGCKEDQAAAFEWYSKAAKSGYAKAQYWLGMMYIEGVWDNTTAACLRPQDRTEEATPTPEALKLASMWIRRALDQGCVDAADFAMKQPELVFDEENDKDL